MTRHLGKVRDTVEWIILIGILFAVVLMFFSHNGFIGHSDIQPYPY